MTPWINRISDAPFSPEEAERIRGLDWSARTPPPCPRCGTTLVLVPATPGADALGEVALLRCGACRRFVVLRDRATRAAGDSPARR